MLSYCYFILCLTPDLFIERSDPLGMNTVACPVVERTFCPYVSNRFGDNPISHQNIVGPLPGDTPADASSWPLTSIYCLY